MYQKNRFSRRQGTVAVLVAVLLTVIVGMLAMPIDGGMMMDNRRRTQAGADAAALAGATQLFKNYVTIVKDSYTVADPGGSAKTAALANAAQNGFSNDGTTSSVTINIPPQSGPFKGKIGYVEALITFYQPRYFSALWGQATTPVQARAVAYAYWGDSGDGIVTLDPTAKDSLNVSGGGTITMSGSAQTWVDSNDSAAAAAVTGGGTLSDISGGFEIVGGLTGTVQGTVTTGVLPIPDPLRALPTPTQPPAGTVTKTSLGNGNFQYTLSPGSYSGLPNFNTGDVVILQQASANNNGGIFYISGGFKSTGASIIMDPNTSGGVMIYNAPTSSASSQSIDITGNSAGTVNLSPLTSGPYAGMLLWQARSSTVSMNIAGAGNFTMLGTLYGANANMQITGNGNAIIGSQYVSRTLNLGGNGNITIDYSVSLTGRVRDVQLVE